MTDTKSAELEAERQRLLDANAAAKSWGAAVGTRHERIKEIDSELRRLRTAAASTAEPVAWRRILQEIAAGRLIGGKAAAACSEALCQLAEGCCSASSPCNHQKASPYTICETCAAARVRALAGGGTTADAMQAIARGEYEDLPPLGDSRRPPAIPVQGERTPITVRASSEPTEEQIAREIEKAVNYELKDPWGAAARAILSLLPSLEEVGRLREFVKSRIINNDSDENNDDCILCDGCGEVSTVEHGPVPCPDCASRGVSQLARAALSRKEG